MTKFILLLLIPVFVFAQSGASLPGTNWNMEADAGWTDYLGGDTNERSLTQAHTGTYSRHLNVNATNEGCIQATPNATVTTGVSYFYGYWGYRVSGAAIGLVNNTANIVVDVTSSGGTGAWQKIYAEATAAGTGTIRPRIVSKGGAAEYYADDVFCRKKLATLYISDGGNDTAEGESGTPIATLSEGFETRIVWGGDFVVNGTFDESINILDNFNTLTGTATITQVDFNSVTGTIGAGISIGTALNDDNIIYLTSDTGDKGFNETPKFNKFPSRR